METKLTVMYLPTVSWFDDLLLRTLHDNVCQELRTPERQDVVSRLMIINETTPALTTHEERG